MISTFSKGMPIRNLKRFFCSSTSLDSSSKIIDCLIISKKCEEKSKEVISKFRKPPKISVFYDPLHFPSRSYIKIKEKKIIEAGCFFKKISIDKIFDQLQLEEEIKIEILKTDFLFLQYPFGNKFNYQRALDLVPIQKDLDGLTTQNFGLASSNNENILPCTTTGILEILSNLKINLKSTYVVIMGDSNIVGRPTYLALRNRGATCLHVDKNTPNIEKITNLADVLIVAIGCPKFIKKHHIKEGAIILDVGINRGENGEI